MDAVCSGYAATAEMSFRGPERRWRSVPGGKDLRCVTAAAIRARATLTYSRRESRVAVPAS